MAAVQRLPFPRSRRSQLVAGAVLLALASGGAALGLSLSSTAGARSGLAGAAYPGYQLSFRYPSDWKRRDWCWVGTAVFPLTLLTTGHSTPRCGQSAVYGLRTPLPPPLRLGVDGVAAWWVATGRTSATKFEPNGSVAGHPARVTVRRESTRRTKRSYVNCRTGETQRSLTAQIEGPSSKVREVQLGAVICGPDFAAGEAEVRRMLASLRFTG
jgi:hypothetical protein